jgi:hypothetical protein
VQQVNTALAEDASAHFPTLQHALRADNQGFSAIKAETKSL